ncbi:hypothetical protein WISP_78551 [Willisornis vidua]|uniref:Uncharacterized protein n=1 Tax=Willisornis vidua TaxID=1566151 RepID=A0ABQ9D9T3_9PASS|nr:hypothetical protein WISP_78551 [Willisornis vidua]
MGINPSLEVFQGNASRVWPTEDLEIVGKVFDKDIKYDWSQYWALGNPTGDWPSAGSSTTHHQSLGPAIQLVFNPVKRAPDVVHDVGCKLFQDNAVGDGVKHFTEV